MAVLSKMLAGWRHRMIAPYIQGDILDIGCGNCIILQNFAHAIDRYCGVEYSTKRFEPFREKFPEAVFYARDLDKDLLDIDWRFDRILLIAIIEHIWNQKFLFAQLPALLKPGGRIVITTPTPFGNDIIHPLGASVGLFARSAVDDHIVIYNRKRFENLANEFDLKLIGYKRFQFFSNQLAVLGRNVHPNDSRQGL